MKNTAIYLSILLLSVMSFGCDSIYELSDIPTDDDSMSSDDELLELTQKTTFNYFWDFADSSSGMAKERSQGSIITSGGSGFGISCFPVAVERGWITKDEAIERMQKILTFLDIYTKDTI